MQLTNKPAEPIIIQAIGGQSIDDFIQQLTEESQKNGGTVMGIHNDKKLEVSPDDSVQDVLDRYKAKSREAAAEYANSPKGIIAAATAQQDKVLRQAKIDQLIVDLETLDFTDFELVLEWFCAIEDAKIIGVSFDKDRVISTFKDHGFDLDASLTLNVRDAESLARFLIHESLNTIQLGNTPYQAIHYYTKDWKKKFGRESQPDEELLALARQVRALSGQEASDLFLRIHRERTVIYLENNGTNFLVNGTFSLK